VTVALPSGRGRSFGVALMSLAFAGAGAISWLLVGAPVEFSGDLRATLVVIGITYGAVYSAAGMLGIRLGTLGTRWQVPARWLRGRPAWQRWLIWGASLGPGFPTRNPYPGFWLLLPIACPGGALAFAAVGAAHGFGRAAGILSNVVRACPMADPTTWGARQRWTTIDRVLMMFGTGLLAGYAMIH
jgi:hypothetical protein